MKILHLSYSDIGGGAAQAAYRIHQSLQETGVDSSMLVTQRCTRDPSVTRFQPSRQLPRRLARGIRRFSIHSEITRQKQPGNAELFSEDRSWLGSELAKGLPECDLIHLHWVAGFVDLLDFLPKAAQKAPLVWTLHDMNPFTGGCHYDGHCGKFSLRCGMCPMLTGSTENDLSRKVWERKRAAFASVPSSRLRLVSPSRWLTSQASQSSLLRDYQITTIPYGLDLQAFAPREKAFARKVLGIPLEAKVVLFVAESISQKRKGYQILLDAIQPLEDLFLLSLGKGEAPRRKASLHLGFVEQSRLLSLVYSAADVFAITSLEDNLPQTLLEAMACGIPAVGFKVGGIPDAILHEKTGLLVPEGDSLLLRATLQSLLSDPDRLATMSAQSRQMALERCDSRSQGLAYHAIYKDLLGSK